jgi:hypothetical protein
MRCRFVTRPRRHPCIVVARALAACVFLLGLLTRPTLTLGD